MDVERMFRVYRFVAFHVPNHPGQRIFYIIQLIIYLDQVIY